MSIEQLNKQLKDKNFSNLYLLYGAEKYLVRYYKKALISAILGEEGGMNFSYFSGKNLNLEEIAKVAVTLPFFSPYRLILIEDTELFSKKNDFSERLNDLPTSTIILFAENSVDKKTKLYKAVMKKGLVVDFPNQPINSLIDWIKSFCKSRQIKISSSDSEHLIKRVGPDMDILYKEMEKLTSYAYEKNVITKEDIDFICPETIEDKIFSLMDSIVAKKREEALSFYYDLIDLKIPPLNILYQITRSFHILKSAKKLVAEGNSRDLASLLKLHPYVATKYLKLSHNYSASFLQKALDNCLSLDKKIKQGEVNETVAIEALVLGFTKG